METWSWIKKKAETADKERKSKGTDWGHTRPGGSFLSEIKGSTHHTHLHSLGSLCCTCVSDIFSIFSFLRAFLCTPLAEAYAASTCPSSCPWGLIPQHQFVLEEDRGLPFIHPFAAPYSTLSDLLSVWHLTPLSLQPWRFTCVSSSRASTQTLWFCTGVNILRCASFVQIFEREQIGIFYKKQLAIMSMNYSMSYAGKLW